MKKIIATLALLAFLAPLSFAVARDASRDTLGQDAKARQEQQEKDKAKFKAIEAGAAKAMQPGPAGVTTPPTTTVGAEVR